jgi:hypothetical protein
VHAECEHGFVAGEYRVRSVALMHIEVDHRSASDATVTLQQPDGDGDVVEHAESLAMIGEGVMRSSGEVHGDTALECRGGGFTRSTNGAKRTLDQRLRPREPNATLLGLAQLARDECVDVALGMHEQ